MSWWREVWQEVPCPVCEAGPGEPCRTLSGRVSYEPHAERARLARLHRLDPYL